MGPYDEEETKHQKSITREEYVLETTNRLTSQVVQQKRENVSYHIENYQPNLNKQLRAIDDEIRNYKWWMYVKVVSIGLWIVLLLHPHHHYQIRQNPILEDAQFLRVLP